MPSKQRKRWKRRESAKKILQKHKKTKDDNIETPIFTEEDYQIDDRISRLAKQRWNNNNKKDIYITDLLELDEIENNEKDNNNDNLDENHNSMLIDMFGNKKIKPKISGSQLIENEFELKKTNINDDNNELINNQNIKKKKLTQYDLLNKLNINNNNNNNDKNNNNKNYKNNNDKLIKKQINNFIENSEMIKLKLNAKINLSDMDIERKKRVIKMKEIQKNMNNLNKSIEINKNRLTKKKNLIPIKTDLINFIDNIDWEGELGNNLSKILNENNNDYIDLKNELNKYKPNKNEIMKQTKKLKQMRLEIGKQIKEFKRNKKIKSRSFRKRMRKRKSKIQPTLEELKELNPILYKREIKKLLKQYAEERSTLKHKNTSKWAQNILRQNKNNNNSINIQSKKDLMNQLQRGLLLKQKIDGLSDDDDDIDNISDNSDNNNNNNNKFITEEQDYKIEKEKMIKENKEKGVWNMKFMKNAELKRKNEINYLNKSMNSHNLFKIDNEINKIQNKAFEIDVNNNNNDYISENINKKREEYKNAKDKKHFDELQSKLGKRKFGNFENPPNKKWKKNLINFENQSVINNGQQIDEIKFGVTTKSVLKNNKFNLDNNNNNNNFNEPAFEMIEFPKHNSTISDINKMKKNELNKIDNKNKLKFKSIDLKAKVNTEKSFNITNNEPSLNIDSFLEIDDKINANDKNIENTANVEPTLNDDEWEIGLKHDSNVLEMNNFIREKPLIKKKKLKENPWLKSLNKKSTENIAKKNDTTILDNNKLLIPEKELSKPDFNLLSSNNEKNLDLINETLNNDNYNEIYKNIDTEIENEFKKTKESFIDESMPNKPEAPLEGWNQWFGEGISNNNLNDLEYKQQLSEWKKAKAKMLENRKDSKLGNVILSDQIGIKSKKYLLSHNLPEWFNKHKYFEKMNETIGREFNLATEYYNFIKPEYDIPMGYNIEPTKNLNDINNKNLNNKIKFGNYNHKKKLQTYFDNRKTSLFS